MGSWVKYFNDRETQDQEVDKRISDVLDAT